MKNNIIMFRKIRILIVLLFLLIIQQDIITAKTGFGPAELFCSNQRDTLIVGTASIINGDDVAKYGVFSIMMPYSNQETFQDVASEIVHARVVCNHCNNEMQRYEAISDYKYGDDLVGICNECGSTDLTFYDVMPRDEYERLSLEGAGNFELRKKEGTVDQYVTTEKISPKGCCNVNILYDASTSYVKENFDKHWEVHLRGSTHESLDQNEFVTGGVDLRVLISFKFPLYINIVSDVRKGEKFTVKITYGDFDKTWNEIPEDVIVSFNGIIKMIDDSGQVSFRFPDTRGDYEYKIEASNDRYYLSVDEMISETFNINMPENNDSPWFYNIYLMIGLIAAIVIIILFLFWFFGGDSR